MLLLWLCWIDIPGIDSGMLNSDLFWVNTGCLSTRGGSPLYRGLSVNLALLEILKGCAIWPFMRSLLFFYKSHRRPGGKNLRGDSAGRRGPASSGTVKQGEIGKRRVRVLTENGEGQRDARDGGDGILQTNRGHGIQKTNNLRGGDQSGREGNTSHTPHHLGSPSHSRPSNIC